MCFGNGNGNSCWWIIILLLIFCCGGCGSNSIDNGCNNNCGCGC